jgi:hypothetical protein
MRHKVGPASVSRRPLERRLAAALTILVGLTALPCPAVEMFTFFGDGSRIGLPSLEVPVEAYPGIPLRSDRLRARRGGQRPTGASAAATPPGAMVRVIPETTAPAPIRAARPAVPLVAPEPPPGEQRLELIPPPRQ